MHAKQPDAARLDMRAFARPGGSLQGELPQPDLIRLAGSLLAQPVDGGPPPVVWQASGELRQARGGEPQIWLHLQVSTVVTLQCQRCLQPVVQPLEVDRHFRFVADEDEAARLDEDSEDDVLVLQPGLDLPALIEDELILALPLVPRHEACPEPLPMSASDDGVAADDVQPHPFAALAALRRPGPVN